MHLTSAYRTENDLSDGFISFVETIANKAKFWGETIATTFVGTRLAEELGVTKRTLRRYTKQFEALELGDLEVKRGVNGGTVVVFNTGILNFEKTDNPIMPDTKEAEEIRDIVFPKAVKPQPLRKYRTKEQKTHDELLAQAHKTKVWELNEKLDTMTYVTREFFDNFDEPDTYYKGYLLSRMYNAYCVVMPSIELENGLKDGTITEEAKKICNATINNVFREDILKPRFVGTKKYGMFVKLQRMLEERNINPLAFFTVQFDFTRFLASVKKVRPSATPLINTLISEKAFERYYKQAQFQKAVRREYDGYRMSNEEVSYRGGTYPILDALMMAYKGVDIKSDFETVVAEMHLNASNYVEMTAPDGMELTQDDILYNRYVNRIRKLSAFHNTVLEDLNDNDITSKSKDIIKKFLVEQLAVHARKNSLSITQYLLAFPVQFMAKYKQNLQVYAGQDNENFYCSLGNFQTQYLTLDTQVDNFAHQGKLMKISLMAGNTFTETIRMTAHELGIGVDIHELSTALTEYGVNKIPLDTTGMLDIAKIESLKSTD